jgi:hypothetical protein
MNRNRGIAGQHRMQRTPRARRVCIWKLSGAGALLRSVDDTENSLAEFLKGGILYLVITGLGVLINLMFMRVESDRIKLVLPISLVKLSAVHST